ncbi:hypothetical protein BT63DRAFT_440215 [Microthyrium microscopicum]|uniref:Uncharacterized protein n=1 Tax=Microthyrium microscopicum TaxID=703497 RepID=A0A6A6UBU2_9PEZI|nr:hypothetical protein BT63DRAFT_440215 [Microthyrium microscopicum]
MVLTILTARKRTVLPPRVSRRRARVRPRRAPVCSELPSDMSRNPEPSLSQIPSKPKEDKPWPRGCPLCQDRFCSLLCPYLKAEGKRQAKLKRKIDELEPVDEEEDEHK